MGIREFMNKKPWIGWLLAGILLVVASWRMFFGTAGRGEFLPEQMAETVTIRFTDTGDEMRITRARLEYRLRTQDGLIDATKGFINPKTGQPTGFLYNKETWESMIKRINEDKSESDPSLAGKPAVAPGDAPMSNEQARQEIQGQRTMSEEKKDDK